MDNNKLLLELDSFRFGTLAALASLKASIQTTPGFDHQVLEDAIRFFLANPPSSGDRDSFEGPLKALLEDRSDFLKALHYQR